MWHHLQRNFELCCYQAQYLSIKEQNVGFQSRHQDKLWIMFKDVCGGFQYDAVCNCGYMYSFIYRNDDIPDLNILFVGLVRGSFRV